MRKLALALLGGAIGLALAFAGLLLLSGGDGHVRAAENDPIAYIGIDMNPTGNVLPSAAGPGALGPRNRCRSVSSAGSPTITVDVYADSIPLDEEATNWSFQFNWSPNGFTQIPGGGANAPIEAMLKWGYYDPNPPYNANVNPGNLNTITPASDPRPDGISPWNAGSALLTAGEQSWEGPQVIVRVSIRITAAGPQVVNLWLNGAPLQVNIVADDEVGVYTNPVGAKIDGSAATQGQPQNPYGPVQLAIDTPCPDSDNDGWSDADEVYLGTDPLDACPDNTSDPAWPLDQDNDTWIKIIDVQKYTGKLFTPVTCPGSAKCRLDLNVDGFILLVGDVTIYAGRLFERCP